MNYVIKKDEENMDCFIDIHCHILPGIDDGAGSMEESMSMLETAAEEGISDMIVTPHYKKGRHNAGVHTILERMRSLQEAADEKDIPVTLHPGNEVYCFEGMEEVLDAGTILTLNGTDRVLVEFSPTDSFVYIRNAVDSLRGMDYIPVIAHTERYKCFLEYWEYVEDLKRMDAEIQVNASGIMGGQGGQVKRFIHRLLKEQLVDYAATDAHDCQRRAPNIKKCAAYLYRKYGSDYAEKITYSNAFRLIQE